jgi:hypothetical protein
MKTQAMGWLAMAVVAAGMNASYHQGGMRWAHQIVNQVGYRTSAVIALATGNAEQFLAEAQLAKAQVVNEQVQARNEVSSCPFERTLTRVQNRIARSQERFDHFRFEHFNDRFNDRFQAAMSAREAQERAQVEVQAARMEAQRDRIEAQLAKIHIPAVAVNAVVAPTPKLDICPRIRVSVPQIPEIKVPSMPEIHINVPGADTI